MYSPKFLSDLMSIYQSLYLKNSSIVCCLGVRFGGVVPLYLVWAFLVAGKMAMQFSVCKSTLSNWMLDLKESHELHCGDGPPVSSQLSLQSFVLLSL